MIKILIIILSKLNLEKFKLHLKLKNFKFLLAYIFFKMLHFETQNFQIDPNRF